MPLLFGTLTNCPKCQSASAFGRSWVGERDLLFRCRNCPHWERLPLPPIQKTIVYLDQFALSKMALRTTDPFWTTLRSRLDQLISDERVACPSSPIHYEESNFDVTKRDDLTALSRQLAGSERFRPPQDVKKRQLERQLAAFIEGASHDPVLAAEDAFERDPHR